MSDENEFENEQPEGETNAMRNAREAAERNRTEADDAKAQLEEAQRENAFLRALPGDAADSPLGKMFTSAYNGDLSTEAIRAAASEVGLITAAPAEPPPPNDVALQATREALRTGATPPQAQADIDAAAARLLDPKEEGLKAFNESIARGTARDDASAEYFDRVIDAAVKGDERAIFKREPMRQS